MADADDLERAKRAAALAAARLVEPGMRVGLGSGTTAAMFVRALGERVRDGLRIRAVATSNATESLARAEGIEIEPLDVDLDIAVDGADAVTANRDALKGFGGALFREKMIALAARRFVLIVDESKRKEVLGDAGRLPIEVMRFGVGRTLRAIEALGLDPALRRTAERDPVVSDNGQYIVDAAFRLSIEPQRLARALDGITGVVEHGLFLGIASAVIVGRRDGTVIEFGIG
jgi:ribose 5-phosphate isomerase A